MPSPITPLPFRQGSVEPSSFMGAFRCTVDPPHSRPTSPEVLVGRGRNQDSETRKKALQRDGHLHTIEHMEGKEHENF